MTPNTLKNLAEASAPIVAEASGSRTHQRRLAPLTGFEDQAQHRLKLASVVKYNPSSPWSTSPSRAALRFMTSLKPGNEVKPAPGKLVAPTYRPDGSFDHLVSDGENWQKLADRYRIPAKKIIEDNFKTTNPYEINWYLREYVNCKVPPPDRYNWTFSTSAREGGIPGRAGKVFIVPNWADIEKAAKTLTKRYVKQWFELCMVQNGMVNGSALTINPTAVRPTMNIASIFAMEFELAGAPRQFAQGWAAHLQQGLELFTNSLHANQPSAYPMFNAWPTPGGVPPTPALPWPLLNSGSGGIANQNWFISQLMFPGVNNPEMQGVIKRHGQWFQQAFQIVKGATMARNVLGQGIADPYSRRVVGTAFASINFLQVPELPG